MTPAERGFLLLTSPLGDPQRKCLSVAQFRLLALRVRQAQKQTDPRQMTAADLKLLGYDGAQAQRILQLLEDEAVLDHYLRRCARQGCFVLPRVSEEYPLVLRRRLGLDAPGSLWCKGDSSLLATPMVAMVGSRDIHPENEAFARQAGRQAAAQGFTLVSGNARGADKTAQEACLAAGGSVISVIADALTGHTPHPRQLLISLDGFDLDFSPSRALSRNRVIHALPQCTIVAQSDLNSGGTWDGTVKNLRFGWSNVYCFDDGSLSCRELEQLGAGRIRTEELQDLEALCQPPLSLL